VEKAVDERHTVESLFYTVERVLGSLRGDRPGGRDGPRREELLRPQPRVVPRIANPIPGRGRALLEERIRVDLERAHCDAEREPAERDHNETRCEEVGPQPPLRRDAAHADLDPGNGAG